MTNEHKVLRGLSYISVIFAPILFPILVWIFTPQGSVTRDTAKHALWLHIIPTLLSIFIFMIIGGVGFFTNSINATSAVSLILLLVAMVVDIGMVVYNIYTGIKNYHLLINHSTSPKKGASRHEKHPFWFIKISP
ncbi:hypothetical protein FAM18110_02112 [Lacticaseibacillus paracasei]|nr:hypothetical protein FAM18110_02112 [Lacticaseibacillus paracasei]